MPQPANERAPRRPNTPGPVPVPASTPAQPTRDPIAALIEFFVSRPGSVQTILAQHRDDGTGHCTLCTAGGQAGRMVWPCRIHDAAITAHQRASSTDASRGVGARGDTGRADGTRGPRR